jgi:hypothetical protein
MPQATDISALDIPEPSEATPKPDESLNQRRTRRRTFLKRAVGGVIGLAAAGLGYSLFEAGWIRIYRTTVTVPRLPVPFRGSTIALLADIHHGPFTSLEYVQQLVQLTNSLSPDVVLLGGDYVHRDGQYIDPCLKALSRLKSSWGRASACWGTTTTGKGPRRLARR